MLGLWRGEKLQGRTLLLHAEQGLGDTLQFCRYASMIKDAKVVLEVPATLKRLLSGLNGVECVVATGEMLPGYDLHCPLMSLPWIFGTTLGNLPAQVPYLQADVAEVARWRARLAALSGLKVGVVWAGGRESGAGRTDARRSLPLDAFAPFAEIPGVSFVSLQKDAAAGQIIDRAPAGLLLQDYTEHLTDFAASAALVQCLDIVITVDTAMVHLAGALGRPVWLLNRFDADWRWLIGREDSPWYPTLRQFRQITHGDWTGVISQVCEALKVLAAARTLGDEELLARGFEAFSAGRLAEAETLYGHLLDRVPDNARAWHMRGLIAHRGKRLEEAVSLIERAIRLDDSQANFHRHLGMILSDQREFAKAEACLRKAIKLRPVYPEALNNLGATLHARGQFPTAEGAFREALRLEPGNVTALNNLGNAVMAQQRLVEAEALYREAARRAPGMVDAYGSLGVLLAEQGRAEEANRFFEEALKGAPERPDLHVNRAMAMLMAGRFEEGWKEYEWRWRTPHFSRQVRDWKVSQWNGEPLENRTLLLHGEQGMGDSLQFARYATLIRDAQIILEVPSPLVRLLSCLPGITRTIATGRPLPPFDLHCPLLSLPKIFGTLLTNVPAQVPYLSAQSDEVTVWRQRAGSLPGLKVGLVWAGEWRPNLAATDARRSLPLQALAPLAEVSGVSFVSLQKGKPAKQTAAPPSGMVLHDFTDELRDFADTAALMECLDLIITVDTAAVHLAGGLGRPVWLLNRYETCWRWLRDREDSPWYPSLRLFRQQRPNEWAPVILRVRDALRGLVRDGA